MNQFKKLKMNKKAFYIILGIILLSILGFKLVAKVKNNTSSKSDPKEIVSTAKQKVELNREFEFKIPIVDDQGRFSVKHEKIKFILTEAEIKEDIKVKGEDRKAKEGQNYLILRIELQNDSPNRLAIISNKYVRLIGLDEKKYSPDFHNAMVAIDPLSVRRDLVAYIINKDSKSFKFQVGDLEGEKQMIEIAF